MLPRKSNRLRTGQDMKESKPCNLHPQPTELASPSGLCGRALNQFNFLISHCESTKKPSRNLLLAGALVVQPAAASEAQAPWSWAALVLS